MAPEWSTKLSDENVRSTIKDLTFFPPVAPALSDDIVRRSCCIKENVIYVYPLLFERISHR
jgi:hypothetical protein